MAIVRPFPALRPRPELASRVAAVPYDVVNTEEARQLAHDPFSFLHVSRAEIDLPSDTDPYADAVYEKAVSNFTQLKRDALLEESRPAVYVYRLRMGAHEQTGVAACFAVEEYRRDLIKKHERTRPEKENDRTRHIIQTRAQSGPVLLTHHDHEALARAVAQGAAGDPLYDFAAADGIQHTIWRTEPDVGDAIIAAFGDIPALYIADGHHRAASAARANEYLAGQAAPTDHEWFLAVAFPASQMQILPYHRVVKDFAAGEARDAASLLDALKKTFPVERGTADVTRKGDCAMYLQGQWHRITLDARPPDAADAAASEAASSDSASSNPVSANPVSANPATADPIASLDVSRLQERVLTPLLGIDDPRTNKRIDFVGGIRGTGELERLVDSGAAVAAFAMFPTTVGELMAIADADGIMPPKSTWFEPKLRDGLLTHLI